VGIVEASWQAPTRLASAVFAAKVVALRMRRSVQDLWARPPRFTKLASAALDTVIAESRTPLRPDPALAEHALQSGKIENLRIACRVLDGIVIPAGAVFSLWRHLGPPLSIRGYVPGRMLREGCMVPAIGGGLCQLSNALYDMALQTGCQIIERHAHSRVVPGSAAVRGRDATIAWNYVDLRFSPDKDIRLLAQLDAGSLIVRILGREAISPAPDIPPPSDVGPDHATRAPRSCGTCDETRCFRHGKLQAPAGGQAFLVDENWPEFQAYLRAVRREQDHLLLPLDGARLNIARYRWQADGFNFINTAPAAAVLRMLAIRRAGLQGPARRSAELSGTERIANSLGQRLTPDVTAVTVAQSYLPFLYRNGVLGGREVSVLMTWLPIAHLHARLDAAFAAHPQQASLADFRAPPWLIALEAEALSSAAQIITPHAEIASLFPDRAIRLDWSAPPAAPVARPRGRRIGFPGPTIARKGAFALRDAAMSLGLEVVPIGVELEGPNFWGPVRISKFIGWENIAVVVQPSLVEDQPRRLLMALGLGIPVIATAACGLDPQPGLTLVPPDDAGALVSALSKRSLF